MVSSQFLSHRSHLSDRPDLKHRKLRLLSVKLCLQDRVSDVIASRRSYICHCTLCFGRQHQLVFDQSVFVDVSIDISSCDVTTQTDILREEVPLEVSGQGWSIDSLWNVDGIGQDVNVSQGPLDTVKNRTHNSRSQFDRKRFPSSKDRISNRYSWCLFVGLNGSQVILQSNDLSYKFLMANSNQFVHSSPWHLFSCDDRTRDGINIPVTALLFHISYFWKFTGLFKESKRHKDD